MIDIAKEDVQGFAEIARRQPVHSNGAGVNASTIWRWAFRGCRSVSNDIVKLEAIKLGGRWLTSSEALQRFADRLSGQAPTEGAGAATQPTQGSRTPAKRARASQKAAEELEALGV